MPQFWCRPVIRVGQPRENSGSARSNSQRSSDFLHLFFEFQNLTGKWGVFPVAFVLPIGSYTCANSGPLRRSAGMKLIINGEDRTVVKPLTLQGLVEHLGMKADRVAVELNRD